MLKTSKALPSARQRVPKAVLRVADATPLMGVGNRLRNRGRASLVAQLTLGQTLLTVKTPPPVPKKPGAKLRASREAMWER